MKVVLTTLLMLIATQAVALESCMTGSWYDKTNPGTGIDVQILGDKTVAYYYTYGSQGKTWYIMLGEGEELTVIGTAPNGSEADVGTARIFRIDDDTIFFEYQLTLDQDDDFGWCLSGFCEDKFVYSRLTKPIPCS